MRHPCGHPYGTVSRHHPCSIARLHRHDATACVDQLIPFMKMGRNRVPRREIDRACNYGEAFEPHLVEKNILSFWRHRLSQYRMRVLEAMPSIQLSTGAPTRPHASTLVMETRHAELPVDTISPRLPSTPFAGGAGRWTGGEHADDSCSGTKSVRHRCTESRTRLLVGKLVGDLSGRTEEEHQQGDSHPRQMPFCRNLERRKRPQRREYLRVWPRRSDLARSVCRQSRSIARIR